MKTHTYLLLLSGGMDSFWVLRGLTCAIRRGRPLRVVALTFNGRQGLEAIGARATACVWPDAVSSHVILEAPWLDEDVRSQGRILYHWLRAVRQVVREGRRCGADRIAAGVKRADLRAWPVLVPLLIAAAIALGLCGVRLVLPHFGRRGIGRLFRAPRLEYGRHVGPEAGDDYHALAQITVALLTSPAMGPARLAGGAAAQVALSQLRGAVDEYYPRSLYPASSRHPSGRWAWALRGAIGRQLERWRQREEEE